MEMGDIHIFIQLITHNLFIISLDFIQGLVYIYKCIVSNNSDISKLK